MTAVLDSSVCVEGEGAAVPEVNTLKAKALHTALSDAILFTTAKALGLPMLEAIRLEFGGGQLIAVATDRFTLGASRVEYSGAAFDMLLEGGGRQDPDHDGQDRQTG